MKIVITFISDYCFIQDFDYYYIICTELWSYGLSLYTKYIVPASPKKVKEAEGKKRTFERFR